MEIICSYEFEGKPLKAISNVCGHNITDYIIYAGKSFYAHSCFQPLKCAHNVWKKVKLGLLNFMLPMVIPSTILNSPSVDKHNHFMVTDKKRLFKYKNPNTLEITKVLRDNIYTLPFSQRDIIRNSQSEFNVNTQLQKLFDDQIVNIFPTIYDPKRGVFTINMKILYIFRNLRQ